MPMSKHIYQDGDWTGVAVRAQFNGQNIEEILHNAKFHSSSKGPGPKTYKSSPNYEGVTLDINLCYQSDSDPGNVELGVLDTSGKLKPAKIKDFIDTLLEEISLEEVKSNQEDVKVMCKKEKIPLFHCRGMDLPNGWKRIDKQ